MKKTFVIILTIIMCAGICFCMSGCGVDDIDVSGYADDEIVLKGVTDEDVTITIADLKAMECKSVKTESTSDKIGKVRATGPELDTVLEPYGVSKADFSKVTFKGKDQYDVKLLNDYMTEHDLYLAFGIDGEPLDAESAPCRLIIPKSDSAYWIRMINCIEFEK